MGFTRFVQIGRVCFINYGSDFGKLCVIIDVLDENRLLVDGPFDVTGIRRQVIPVKRICLTDLRIKIPRSAGSSIIRSTIQKEDILNKWKQTRYAQKIEKQKLKLQMTDFDRFRDLVARNSGERSWLFYTVESDNFHFMNTLNCSKPLCGVNFLPKTLCEIESVSVCQCLTLFQDKIIPLQFQVPRKRKEFFQDDLFIPTLDPYYEMSFNEWKNAKNIEVPSIDLCPGNMTPLSQAPPEELTQNQKKHLKYKAQSQAEPEKGIGGMTEGELFDKMTLSTKKMVTGRNRWDATPQASDDVAEDEWD